MPRARRHFTPGHIWHITHRCHKKEFLLKFAKDRQRWMHWLFEAKKRYGLVVLDFMITSNHIHLLVVDTGKDIIPQSLQLIAGRTAQEFNIRKKRKGVFWEDSIMPLPLRQTSILQDVWSTLISICSEPVWWNIYQNMMAADIMRFWNRLNGIWLSTEKYCWIIYLLKTKSFPARIWHVDK